MTYREEYVVKLLVTSISEDELYHKTSTICANFNDKAQLVLKLRKLGNMSGKISKVKCTNIFENADLLIRWSVTTFNFQYEAS